MGIHAPSCLFTTLANSAILHCNRRPLCAKEAEQVEMMEDEPHAFSAVSYILGARHSATDTSTHPPAPVTQSQVGTGIGARSTPRRRSSLADRGDPRRAIRAHGAAPARGTQRAS